MEYTDEYIKQLFDTSKTQGEIIEKLGKKRNTLGALPRSINTSIPYATSLRPKYKSVNKVPVFVAQKYFEREKNKGSRAL